jgi:hypothetical protein
MKKGERGQVLILIILTAVVLFGVAALAVDGGRYYAERRRAQNAADAAALAAAFASTDSSKDWSQAAMGQAQENDYNDTNPAKQDGLIMDVHVHNPPISGKYQGNKQYYQVIIRNKVDFIFAQFVYNGKLEIQVEAVAKAEKEGNPYPGAAFVATSPHECNAVNFSGGGETTIDGGDVFSNSDGTGNCASGLQNGSGSLTVENGDIQVAGDWVTKGKSGSVSPKPAENVDQMEDPDLPVPDCKNGVLDRNKDYQDIYSKNHQLEPGSYDGIKITNGDWTMKPGMYCFTKTGFDFNGGSLTGIDVFLVINGGDVKVNGSGDVTLRRPDSLKDAAGVEWGGMLIYMPYSNQGGIDLSGGSSTSYAGTILAPGPRSSSKPKCTISGNAGSIGMNANIICNTLEVTGTAEVKINFNPKQNWQQPPRVSLSQ